MRGRGSKLVVRRACTEERDERVDIRLTADAAQADGSGGALHVDGIRRDERAGLGQDLGVTEEPEGKSRLAADQRVAAECDDVAQCPEAGCVRTEQSEGIRRMG